MQMIPRFVLGILLMATAQVHADAVSAKGTASVSYSAQLSPEIKQDALKKAKVNALDRYFADANAAKAKNYELIRDQIVSNPDTYVLGVTVLNEDNDEKAKTYNVVVRADLNTNKLDNSLTASSSVANTAADQKSTLTFVFVARQQKSVQGFDDKVYKRNESKSSQGQESSEQRKTAETESVRRSSVKTADSNQESSSSAASNVAETTSGGSTTRKSDVVEWDVTRAGDINSVMTGAFSAGGYEVVEAEYLETESNGLLNIESIRNDYRRGDDLAPTTLRNTVGGVKAASVPLLALGTLDIGLKDVDPASGLTRVFVSVSGKVLNVTGRFPKTVSSVGPVQFAGIGPNESVARTNALKLAAQSAASQLINEMNAKGVQ